MDVDANMHTRNAGSFESFYLKIAQIAFQKDVGLFSAKLRCYIVCGRVDLYNIGSAPATDNIIATRGVNDDYPHGHALQWSPTQHAAA